MKIHIIGGSGTGKSYFAKQLSSELKIPHFDLDHLQWDQKANTYGVKMPVERRDALLKEILEKDDWIIEGVYYQWCLSCFHDADIIYVLEIPKRVYTFRIIKRFIKRKLGIEKGKKETLKSVRELLKWTDKFQEVNLKEIKKILKQYDDKVVFVKSSRELKNRN